MVHYIINPWRYRHELLEVRKEFYPAPNTSLQEIEQGRQHAVALVSVWEQRGNCPHLVAATALLTAAILNDTPGISSFCVRAAYSAAFSRFVTGLLDGYQDKKYKLSMFSIAKTIGLPASFVEVRHQAIHEDLPSLNKLRSVSQRAMKWIWDFYWKDLSPLVIDEEPKSKTSSSNVGEEREMGMESRDLDVLREELRLGKELASENTSEKMSYEPVRDLDDIKREMMMMAEEEEEEIESGDEIVEGEDSGMDAGCGWDPWSGPWIPKPIGVTV